MEYKPLETGIEVMGQSVFSFVDAFKLFTQAASGILIEEGIGGRGPSGEFELDLEGWYPQEAFLRAFSRLGQAGDEKSLFRIGLRIPENARFPPSVSDIDSAIGAVDIAYHMNHRKGGRVMFDETSGELLEGIGHYGHQRVPGENRIVSTCTNPYPCAFDRGILTAMARKFEPDAEVAKDKKQPCRNRGADSCTYIITW